MPLMSRRLRPSSLPGGSQGGPRGPRSSAGRICASSATAPFSAMVDTGLVTKVDNIPTEDVFATPRDAVDHAATVRRTSLSPDIAVSRPGRSSFSGRCRGDEERFARARIRNEYGTPNLRRSGQPPTLHSARSSPMPRKALGSLASASTSASATSLRSPPTSAGTQRTQSATSLRSSGASSAAAATSAPSFQRRLSSYSSAAMSRQHLRTSNGRTAPPQAPVPSTPPGSASVARRRTVDGSCAFAGAKGRSQRRSLPELDSATESTTAALQQHGPPCNKNFGCLCQCPGGSAATVAAVAAALSGKAVAAQSSSVVAIAAAISAAAVAAVALAEAPPPSACSRASCCACCCRRSNAFGRLEARSSLPDTPVTDGSAEGVGCADCTANVTQLPGCRHLPDNCGALPTMESSEHSAQAPAVPAGLARLSAGGSRRFLRLTPQEEEAARARISLVAEEEGRARMSLVAQELSRFANNVCGEGGGDVAGRGVSCDDGRHASASTVNKDAATSGTVTPSTATPTTVATAKSLLLTGNGQKPANEEDEDERMFEEVEAMARSSLLTVNGQKPANEEDEDERMFEEVEDEWMPPVSLAPDGGTSWDWPLSRQERKVRIQMIDQQISVAEHTALLRRLDVVMRGMREKHMSREAGASDAMSNCTPRRIRSSAVEDLMLPGDQDWTLEKQSDDVD
eukprot:TRINITY_DN3445_c0_g1_i1.p1 TRINITY_DN3445_c0_g1~~TRINITY_DN3445_c0_g1_i1.p1  ORF type:complete len:685 (+),score=114.10 TRINITY_DN3445_c0_g1_i1:202-2256(+)